MSQPPRQPWILCGLLFCATALSFLDRQVLSVLAPSILHEFSMSNTDYSRVIFAFVLSYTVMFAVGGRVMDLLGTRLGMGLAVAAWSLAAGAHALAAGALSLGAARFLLGFGEGACFPGATKGAVEWFPLERRVLAIGIANGGSAFGAVLAPPLTAMLAAHFGWRGAFLVVGALGGLWVLSWALAWRRAAPATQAVAERPGPSPPVRSLLAMPFVRRALIARFLFDPVFYFYLFWIPQYLSRDRGFSLDEIGRYYWVPFLVLGLSTICSGRLSDLMVLRGWPAARARMALLFIAAAITPSSWLASVAPTPLGAIGLMALLMFAHGIWISNYLGLLSDRVPPTAIATVTGLSGAAGGIAAMLSNLAIGPVVDRFGFAPVFLVSAISYPLAAFALLDFRKRPQPLSAELAAGSIAR